MAEILARFADGRLLVREEKRVTEGYKISSAIGVPFQIGLVQTVEKVLSIEAFVSGRPGLDGHIEAPLTEVKIHSSKLDTLLITMRRGDLGIPTMNGLLSGVVTSSYSIHSIGSGFTLPMSGSILLAGPIMSGTRGQTYLSSITSGLAMGGELLSGFHISGYINVLTDVIAF